MRIVAAVVRRGASLTSSHGAVGEEGRVENGGGVRGSPGPGEAQRGGPDPRPGPGSAASESREEAKGSGGGHPAGQAQVGAGVEGPRQEEVLTHDPGQGPSHLLGTENEGAAGEETCSGPGTAAAGGEAERARGEEAAAGGEPEAASGERTEGGDRPSDPEPAEAQAGEEEAAAAGGEAGHAGPAPEDTRAAQSSHGLRWETGHRDARPGQLGFLWVPLLSRGDSSARWAGVAARALGVGQTAGRSCGRLRSAVIRRNPQDPPCPVKSGCC